MLILRTLGAVELVTRDGRKLHTVVAQPKRLALLVYLALARPRGSVQRRDSLLALFWPEVSADRARGALSQALTFLRRALGEHVVVATSADEVGLAGGMLGSDVVDFEAALERGEYEGALALYGGDLLEGFHVDDAPGFERWLDSERQALRARAVDAARSLATTSAARGDHAGARTWADWTVSRLSSDDEAGLRDVMALLERIGDRAAALRAYGAFACRLREEYDLAPTLETEQVVSRIRSRANRPAVTIVSPDLLVPPVEPPAPTAAEQHGARSSGANAVADARFKGAYQLRWTPRTVALTAVATLGVVLTLLIARADERAATMALDPTRVVVAPFDNATGDSALAPLGRIAADWVAHGLTRTGLVDVVDPASALAAARNVDSASHHGRQGSDWLRAVGRDAKAGLVVTGAYYRVGDSLHLRGRIVDARTGAVIRSVDPVRVPVAVPMVAVQQFRTRLMGALASVADTRVDGLIVPASSPPTYEAYRAYIEGLELFSRVRYAAALPHFERAARLDSTFILPLLWAAMAHGNSGNGARRDSLLERLVSNRDHLAPADRHGLDALVAARQGDATAELRALRDASDLAPQSNWTFMLGARALSRNRPREAVAALTRLDPTRGWVRGWPPYWLQLSYAYHRLGDHAADLALIRSAKREFPEVVHLRGREAMVLAALGRTDDVDQIIARVVATPVDTMQPGPVEFMGGTAIEYHAHGRNAEGRAMAERCAVWAAAAPDAYNHNIGRATGRADCAYLAGRFAEAESLYRSIASRAADDPRESSRIHRITAYGRLGVLAARRGRRAEAVRLWATLDSLPEYIPGSQANVLAQARIAAALGDRDGATRLLRRVESAGIALGWNGDHNIDYVPLRGLPAFDELTRPRDEVGWAVALGRLGRLAQR